MTPLIFKQDNFQRSQSLKRSSYLLYSKKSYQKAHYHYLTQLELHIFKENGILLDLWLELVSIQ